MSYDTKYLRFRREEKYDKNLKHMQGYVTSSLANSISWCCRNQYRVCLCMYVVCMWVCVCVCSCLWYNRTSKEWKKKQQIIELFSLQFSFFLFFHPVSSLMREKSGKLFFYQSLGTIQPIYGEAACHIDRRTFCWKNFFALFGYHMKIYWLGDRITVNDCISYTKTLFHSHTHTTRKHIPVSLHERAAPRRWDIPVHRLIHSNNIQIHFSTMLVVGELSAFF